MTPNEIFERETSKLKWYHTHGIPQSTASNLVASFKRGQLKKKTIDKYLRIFGYEKVREEQWENTNP